MEEFSFRFLHRIITVSPMGGSRYMISYNLEVGGVEVPAVLGVIYAVSDEYQEIRWEADGNIKREAVELFGRIIEDHYL